MNFNNYDIGSGGGGWGEEKVMPCSSKILSASPPPPPQLFIGRNERMFYLTTHLIHFILRLYGFRHNYCKGPLG